MKKRFTATLIASAVTIVWFGMMVFATTFFPIFSLVPNENENLFISLSATLNVIIRFAVLLITACSVPAIYIKVYELRNKEDNPPSKYLFAAVFFVVFICTFSSFAYYTGDFIYRNLRHLGKLELRFSDFVIPSALAIGLFIVLYGISYGLTALGGVIFRKSKNLKYLFAFIFLAIAVTVYYFCAAEIGYPDASFSDNYIFYSITAWFNELRLCYLHGGGSSLVYFIRLLTVLFPHFISVLGLTAIILKAADKNGSAFKKISAILTSTVAGAALLYALYAIINPWDFIKISIFIEAFSTHSGNSESIARLMSYVFVYGYSGLIAFTVLFGGVLFLCSYEIADGRKNATKYILCVLYLALIIALPVFMLSSSYANANAFLQFTFFYRLINIPRLYIRGVNLLIYLLLFVLALGPVVICLVTEAKGCSLTAKLIKVLKIPFVRPDGRTVKSQEKISMLKGKAIKNLGGSLFTSPWMLMALACLIYSAIISSASSAAFVGMLIVMGPLSYGLAKLQVAVARGNKFTPASLKDLFSGFANNFKNTCALGILQYLFLWLWSLLLIFPGAMMSYSYSMAFYILQDNPDMTWRKALDESRRLMYGNRGKLFALDLSFIGWYILGGILLGVGTFFVVPYHEMARAHFYLDLVNADNAAKLAEETQTEQTETSTENATLTFEPVDNAQ